LLSDGDARPLRDELLESRIEVSAIEEPREGVAHGELAKLRVEKGVADGQHRLLAKHAQGVELGLAEPIGSVAAHQGQHAHDGPVAYERKRRGPHGRALTLIDEERRAEAPRGRPWSSLVDDDGPVAERAARHSLAGLRLLADR
jgi:hypothetical protein